MELGLDLLLFGVPICFELMPLLFEVNKYLCLRIVPFGEHILGQDLDLVSFENSSSSDEPRRAAPAPRLSNSACSPCLQLREPVLPCCWQG